MTRRAVGVLGATCALGGLAIAALVVIALPALTPWPLVLLGGLASLVPIAVGAVRGRVDAFEPVHLFAAVYAVLFVARPAADLAASPGPPVVFGYSTGPGLAPALLLALVGLLSFYAGYWSRLGPAAARVAPALRARLPGRLLAGGVAVALLVSLGLFAIFAAESGGPQVLALLLHGRSPEQQQSYLASSGYFYGGPLWLTGPALLVLATTRRWRSVRGAVGVLLLLASQALNVAGGNRSWMLPAACGAAMLWYLCRGRRPSGRVVAAAVAAGFLLGVAAPALYRNAGSESPLDAVREAVGDPSGAVAAFVQGPDTAMVDDLAVELEFVPSIVPHAGGATYVADLLTPVPRGLWPDKPTDGDDQLMALIWPAFARAHVGFSFSLFGEPYLNFGVAGVALISAALGMAGRALYAWLVAGPSSPQRRACFAISYPFLAVYLWGGLGVAYQRQVIALLPVLAIAAVAELRARQAVGVAPPAVGGEPAR